MKAWSNFEIALKICENSNGKCSTIDIGNIYDRMGIVRELQGHFEKAYNLYLTALNNKKIELTENHPLVAETFFNLGCTMRKKGAYDQALEFYKEALEINLKFREKHLVTANIYHDIGVTLMKKGDYEQALLFYHHALRLYTILVGETHHNIASTYHNIGLVHKNRSQFDQAIIDYNKALVIYRKIHKTENHKSIGRLYQSMGVLFEEKAEYKQALNYFEKALDIQIQDKGNTHPRIGELIHNIGNVQLKKNNIDEALSFYASAQHIFLNSVGEKHPNTIRNYNSITSAYQSKGVLDSSFHYISKAVASLSYSINKPLDFSKVPYLIELQVVIQLIIDHYTIKYQQSNNSFDQDSIYSYYKTQIALEEHIQLEHTNSDTRQHYVNTSLPIYEGALGNLLQF